MNRLFNIMAARYFLVWLGLSLVTGVLVLVTKGSYNGFLAPSIFVGLIGLGVLFFIFTGVPITLTLVFLEDGVEGVKEFLK